MAKNQNTFAKQQREMEKRRKAELKRVRRTQRKSAAVDAKTETPSPDHEPSMP